VISAVMGWCPPRRAPMGAHWGRIAWSSPVPGPPDPF